MQEINDIIQLTTNQLSIVYDLFTYDKQTKDLPGIQFFKKCIDKSKPEENTFKQNMIK